MRILTVIAGTLLCGVGAFCFAFYANAFSGVAFVVGVALMIVGILEGISYLVSGRRDRLPDTVLVEAVVNFFLGFAVLNNQVQDAQISLFFGIWLLMAGATRISQSLAVSRINPKNWFAVMPLGIFNTVYGAVMMMPGMLNDISPLALTSLGFILNGFSLIIYAMYMIKRTLSDKALEAKERSAAKAAAAEAKRAKRDELRQLSREERLAAKDKERREKRETIAAERAKRQSAKQAEREARAKQMDDATLQLSSEEVEQINEAAEAAALPEIKEEQPAEGGEALSFEDLWVEEDRERELLEAKTAEEAAKVSFNKPVNIPSLREAAQAQQPAAPVEEEPKADELDLVAKRAVVNLEEMENYTPQIELPQVELPEVEFSATGGEAAKRESFLLEIDETQTDADDEIANFTPLTLEELFSDEQFNIKPLRDAKSAETDLKLTRTFTFDWLSESKAD